MYKAPNINTPQATKVQFTPQARLDGGLDLVDKEWKIKEDKTSKCLNMWFNNGELGKRYGQSYLSEEIYIWNDTVVWDDTDLWDDTLHWTDSLETPTYTVYKYAFQGHIIKHCGTVLYKQNITTGVTSAIYTGLTAKVGSFFKFNDILYFRQTGNYIQWDGTTASVVVPYVPTVIINRTPTGGGTTNEGYNRIGTAFINSFNGNGSATIYTLTDTNLDATTVTLTINGVAINGEGTFFTVNRTLGTINFAAGTSPFGAPPSGTNNVIVTAYKTNTTDINSVLHCKYSATFGGLNDNRVFAGGNGTGVYYWTGISVGADATYWEYNNFNIIGDIDEDITGFGEQYETLCIFKANSIFGVNYSFDGIVGVFNSFHVNRVIGCDAPNTILNINNNLCWLNGFKGAFTLVGTAVESQRNVQRISRNIDYWLLAESGLSSACAVDFEGKYWLSVGTHVYVWDYYVSPYVDNGNPDSSAQALSWWYFENINAHSYITDGNSLYHVDRTNSRSVIFQNLYHDFGVAINSLYRFPMRDYGNGVYMFDVLKVFVDVRGDTKTTMTVTYFTSDDLGGIVDTETFTVGSFSFNNFSFPNFTLMNMGVKTTFTLIPNEKNIELFGIEFTNNDYGRDLNLSSITVEYKIKKEKR